MGTMWPSSLQTTYQYHNDPVLSFRGPLLLKENDIKLIGEYYVLIEPFLKNDYPFIKKALSKFSILKQIPQDSELLILGYFSIIESLITHAPRSNETLDSINHQIANKIILLRKRFDRTINYSEYFDCSGNEETIWKKLYSYRSCLAHGSEPDFTNKLRLLKDKKTVCSFVQEVLKLIIIISLREPELISDLRNC